MSLSVEAPAHSKHQYLFTNRRGIISQKILIFINATMKTRNHTEAYV